MSLSNRNALVVGGRGVLGAEIARLFRDNGAAVITADQIAGDANSVMIDLTSSESVRTGIAAANERLNGRIDILVNAAGVLGQADVEQMPDELWQRSIAVNLSGIMRTCREVLPQMRARRWGRIINVASQLGLKGGAGMSHYTAAKAGVIGFTKSLALEVAGDNVLANVIAPGPFNTPMLASLSQEWLEAKVAELPLGRFGEPNEVAPTAVLLASDPGGNLFVGQTLGPNCGDVMP